VLTDRELVECSDGQPEQQRRPELPSVKPDGLGDELPDRAVGERDVSGIVGRIGVDD
jgi:hypothetical protein